MSHLRASTNSHLVRRMGSHKVRTALRGIGTMGDDSEGIAMAQAEMLQSGFSQQQIDALSAAGADESTMMGVATADNPSSAYNGTLSLLTGVPTNQLASVGGGAGTANFWNTSTILSGVPNYMLVGGLAVLALLAMTAEKRYR